MQIRIRGHEIFLTEEVKKYAEEKINRLEGYGIKILGVDIVLEEDHNKTENTAAQAKMKVKIAGNDIEAIGTGKTIFAAIDESQENAITQLTRRNDKTESKNKLAKSKQIIRKLFGRE